MAGGYSCSFGHTWSPRDGHAPTACPVCGDTLLLPIGGTPTHAAASAHGILSELDLASPPGDLATMEYMPGPPPSSSSTDTPSFSSLVGMPATEHARAVAGDLDDVVPFAEAVDFVPPSVPGYEILGEVGRGGMGVVYKARQLSLNRPVALKMILAGSHAGVTERDRFRREAEAVATLQNPHIVQIFEIGESNGHLYLALEYVEGGNLAEHLKNAPWAARDAAELVELIARAVQYAHNQGVVHRDLKPGNVLLQGPRPEGPGEFETTKAWAVDNVESSDLRFPVVTHRTLKPEPRHTKAVPKITDFGLAKRLGDTANPEATKTGAVMGTPSYIAPEQASGKSRDVGPSVDVYALGAILYELLTGRPPFMGETALDTVLQVLHDDPVPPKRLQPTVPRDLETICLKCLNKSSAKRYASADAVGDDLRRFLMGEPIKARPLSAWGRGVKWARRHPSMAILATFTVVATISLVSVLSVAYAQVRDAVLEKDAEANAARRARELETKERERAEALAEENEQARRRAVEQNDKLKAEAERTRRAAFALQLAQIAAMCERNPMRARDLLEDASRCPTDLRDFSWAYLHRMCLREERAYREHHAADRLEAVAYAPNGSFVATAGAAGQVRVWDPRSGRTWAVLAGPVGTVTGVAFSPDSGVVAACGTDRAIRMWELPSDLVDAARKPIDLQPPDELEPLEPDVELVDAHAAEVNCIAFSPDGQFLVSGGEDGYLQWWKLDGWRPSNPMVGLYSGLGAFLATRERAADSSNLVERGRRHLIQAQDKNLRAVRALAFASSGKILVSGSADGRARVWAPNGTNMIAKSEPHSTAVRAVAASPDGRVVVTVNNGTTIRTIRVINAEDGKDVRRMIGHIKEISALAMSPDGDLLASAGFDKTVRLWSLDDGQERGVLQGHETAVTGVAFGPDRRTLVSVSLDATARVWHTTSRPSDAAETFRDAPLASVALSGNGTTLFGGDDRGSILTYRSDILPAAPGVPPGATPFAFHQVMRWNVQRKGGDQPPKIMAAAASRDGQTLIASTEHSVLLVWRALRTLGGLGLAEPLRVRVPLPVYAMAVDPSGRWLATLDGDGVRVLDLRAMLLGHPGKEPVAAQGPGLIHSVRSARELAFHPSRDWLAVAVGEGARVIDLKGKLVAEVDAAAAHASEVEAVAFDGAAGDQVATADRDGVIKVWKLTGGRLNLQAELAGHTGAVFSLAFSPDGRTLASGGDDRAVVLWDPVTGQERAVLTGHVDRVVRVQFLPDTSALLTVGRDGSVRRWRAVSIAQPGVPPRPGRD